MDTLGHLLALRVTPANQQDRAQVGDLAKAVQLAAAQKVEVAFVDQGYTGSEPAKAAADAGLRLEVVKHHEAKRGFILLPRRWVVELSFAWAARFRRLARGYERLVTTLAGCHWLAFAMLMLKSAFPQSAGQALEPVMHFLREKSVHCKYLRALGWGWRPCEKHIQVMSAMRNGSFVLRTSP